MEILNICENTLKEKKSYDTAYEISTQPLKWEILVEDFQKKQNEIKAFLDKVGYCDDVQIIFTGAGTSEYIGNILEPLLKSKGIYNCVSIATTDIVNNPTIYLNKNKKTILVSFARSGDSPESVATVELANKLIDDVYHIFITCNKNGALAKMSEQNEKMFLFLMPEGTNDKGFAMTSSFSSMLMAAILIFYKPKNILDSIAVAKNELISKIEIIKNLAYKDHDRIVILGSGALKGLAHELTLKVMELSAGLSVAKYDTVLGFRHGPKSIINNKTIVFLCNSPCEYASQYDKDIFNEMYEENTAADIVMYTLKPYDEFIQKSIYPDNIKGEEIITAIFTYLIYGQMFAFFKSQYYNLNTDNPFPTGEVNRVVKKFKIYNFEKEGE